MWSHISIYIAFCVGFRRKYDAKVTAVYLSKLLFIDFNAFKRTKKADEKRIWMWFDEFIENEN